MDLYNDIEEHVKCLEELIINQHEIIEKQDKMIQMLRESLKTTEKSREYWIDKYYKLSEEVM